MIFETHAHYDDEAFDTDREGLLEALPALYRFDSTIKTHVFHDLEISFSSIVLD